MIYRKEQTVSSTQLDSQARLSLIGIFGIVETAITECMGAQEIDGMTVRRKYNAFWVFTKNRVKILKSLSWGEKYNVESFISNVTSAKLYVDTALKTIGGEMVAYSRCEMCVLDVSTGRIVRTSSVGVDEKIAVEQPQINVEFEKIDDGNLSVVGSVVVQSTNIDFSQHCNNVEYLRFLFNTYSVKELADSPVKEIEVNYVNQSYEGDELTVHKLNTEMGDTLAIKKDGKTVIKGVIKI